ncbi:hypothetical protein EDC04DRAFT_2870045 [Pisolithus marmoratus]|nr:hypothetical protein EDC04DRAFT_2870045 [Pisolithus marmoratus]
MLAVFVHWAGNLSKWWNKHNSFLFTPAGLPCIAVHQEYNVHFLCTSNIAPPLEMLDASRSAQDTGIWAWDCIHKEQVLVIPSVLALLGDNPMQSELACHVGLMGKYFCHVCSDGPQSDGQESIRSEGEEPAAGKSRGKRKETMNDMVSQIKQFVKTSTGLKDTYLERFLDEMAASYKKIHGSSSKQQALEKFIQGLPKNVMHSLKCNLMIKVFTLSFKLTGLDPHSDTPVEVLHTALLGFNKMKCELLEAHLSSFDTTGLGIPPLYGHLVQYAAQAAPFVLHGLVPQQCYDTWVALSKMIPLIWQPEIEDVDIHLVCEPKFLCIRHNLKLQLKTSLHTLHAGHQDGSTHPSSISSFIL